MFSLIITIISIALVAALAIATLYYGGSAFSQGSAKAVADTVISQAQQIAGANTLYANDNGGAYAATVSALVTNNYLASSPAVPAAASTSAYVLGAQGGDANGVSLPVNGSGASAVCTAIAKAAGSVTNTATAPNSTSSSSLQYDCAGASGSFTFTFKG